MIRLPFRSQEIVVRDIGVPLVLMPKELVCHYRLPSKRHGRPSCYGKHGGGRTAQAKLAWAKLAWLKKESYTD